MATRHVLYAIDMGGNAVAESKKLAGNLKLVGDEAKKMEPKVGDLRKLIASFGGDITSTGGRLVNLTEGLHGLSGSLGKVGMVAGGSALALVGIGVAFSKAAGAATEFAKHAIEAEKRIRGLGMVATGQVTAVQDLARVYTEAGRQADAMAVKFAAGHQQELENTAILWTILTERAKEYKAAIAGTIAGGIMRVAGIDPNKDHTANYSTQGPWATGYVGYNPQGTGTPPSTPTGGGSSYEYESTFKARSMSFDPMFQGRTGLTGDQIQRLGAHMEAVEATNDKMVEIQQEIAGNTAKRDDVMGALGGIMGGDFAGMLGGALQGAIGGPFGMIAAAILSLGPELGGFIENLSNQMLTLAQDLPTWIDQGLEAVTAHLDQLPDIVTAVATVAPEIVMQLIRNAPAILGELIQATIEIPFKLAGAILELPEHFFIAIRTAIRDLPKEIGDSIAMALRGLFDPVKNAFTDDKGRFLGIHAGKHGDFLGIDLTGSDKRFFGLPFGRHDIPKMASGGDVLKEGLAYLHAGERVVPAAQVTNNHNGGNTIHIHLSNPDPARLVEQLRKVLGDFNRGLTLSPVG